MWAGAKFLLRRHRLLFIIISKIQPNRGGGTVTHTMRSSQRAYILEFEERPRYCFGRLTAQSLRMDDADQYVSEIAERCKRTAADKLLIERRVGDIIPRVLAYYKVG